MIFTQAMDGFTPASRVHTFRPAMSNAAQSPRAQLKLPDWLVQNRNFVLLWGAYGVAAIGDHLSEMALLSERGGLDRHDATRVQALISFGFFLPFVLIGPFAGWWSDRFSRKITMIFADLLRAVLVFNLAFIVMQLTRWFEPGRFAGVPALLPWGAALPKPISEPLPGIGDMAIVIPLAIVGALAAFFSPARQAMLPTLIRDDQLVRANAMINALGTIGGITGGVLGGVLVNRLGKEGLHYNYYLNAATFVCSALFVSFIAMRQTRAVPHPALAGIWTPIRDGFRYVRQHQRVFQLILLGTVFWASAGIVVSVVPAIVRDVFQGNIQDVAIYRGLMVVGLAVGAAVMSIIGPALPLQLAVLIALSGAAGWLLLLAATYVFKLGSILTGLCLFGVGGAGAALLVTITATMQRFVPDSRRGRVFGVNDMFTMGAMVAASGVLGLAPIPDLDRYIPMLLLLTMGALASSALLSWRRFRRGSEVAARTWVSVKLIELFARFWCRAKRIGPCTVPARGPALIAANHTTGIDPIMIVATCPLRLPSFLVAREYYRRPLAKFFCDMNSCIPINRENPGKSFLSGAMRLIERGGVLGIFPQGRFQVPGETENEPLAGAGAIALRTGVPVIPVHISGTKYRDNPFASFFVRHNVRVRYGPPIDLSQFKGRERDKDAAREVSALIMRRIQELGRADEAAAAQSP